MNSIKIFDIACHWNINLLMPLKYMILNVINKDMFGILILLTLISSLDNKSLIISIFSFSTAKYKAVLLIYIHHSI